MSSWPRPYSKRGKESRVVPGTPSYGNSWSLGQWGHCDAHCAHCSTYSLSPTFQKLSTRLSKSTESVPYDPAFLPPIPFIQSYLKITMDCLRRAGGLPHLSTAVAVGMKTSEQRRLAAQLPSTWRLHYYQALCALFPSLARRRQRFWQRRRQHPFCL